MNHALRRLASRSLACRALAARPLPLLSITARFGRRTLALSAATTLLGCGYAVAGALDGGTVSGNNTNIAIGTGASSTSGASQPSIAIGVDSTSTDEATIAIGTGAWAIGQRGLALGFYTTASMDAVAIGGGAQANYNNSLIIGSNAYDTNSWATVFGSGSRAGQFGLALGIEADATATHSIAIGRQTVAAEEAVSLGNQSGATAKDAVAVGFSARADDVNSVALGAYSVATPMTNAAAFNPNPGFALAGLVPVGQVSVGAPGAERRLTNVAAGAAPTDAVNVSQLRSALSTITPAADIYAQVNTQISALENQITNVSNAQGVDALYFRADGSQTSADAAYAAPGTHGVAAGANAVAAADRGVAVGNGASANATGAVASATAAGSVALGADSVATRENTVSVGAAGNERQITNVAAGTAPTDAVNVSQLQSAQADTINVANAYADRQVADARRDSYAGSISHGDGQPAAGGAAGPGHGRHGRQHLWRTVRDGARRFAHVRQRQLGLQGQRHRGYARPVWRRGRGRLSLVARRPGGCSVGQRALHGFGIDQPRQQLWVQADQVAAPPAVDVDALQLQHGRFHVHRHALARAERGGAAHHVAAVALRHLGLARLHALAADLARQVLGRDRAVAVHQHHQRLRALVFHHQRLDDIVLGYAELARRLAGAAVFDIFVGMLAEGHAVLAQVLRGRGFGDVLVLAHVMDAAQPRGWCCWCSSRRRSRATCV